MVLPSKRPANDRATVHRHWSGSYRSHATGWSHNNDNNNGSGTDEPDSIIRNCETSMAPARYYVRPESDGLSCFGSLSGVVVLCRLRFSHLYRYTINNSLNMQ